MSGHSAGGLDYCGKYFTIRFLQTTEKCDRWMSRLRDHVAKARITRYFERQQLGEAITGDIKMVAPKIVEVRFHIGPGYRVYLTQEGKRLVLLLVGGDKRTQERDIEKAGELAREWRKELRHENKEV